MTKASAAVVDPEVLDVREIADGVELDLFLPETLSCFQGHFPEFPVLPGVAQIDWAVRFADRHLGTAIGGAQRVQVKFRSIIRPGGPLTLRLIRPAGANRLLFEFRKGDEVHSTGTIALEKDA